MSGAEWVDETSPLDPQTDYARSKVQGEEALRELAGDGFSPIFARNGTVYGLSPRMRLDTVLNNLVAAALTTGKVVVHSDGKPWRPVVHVKDLVRTFHNYIEAPIEKVHNQAFNNGADQLNYQIRRLAEIAVEVVPGATLEIQAQAGADQRTYKASFAKFASTFPDFKFEWTPETGARELADAFRAVNLSAEDVKSGRYIRLQWLQKLLGSGELDANLRWTA
jgi:nucleoside-diphosphate-sugar epimerase